MSSSNSCSSLLSGIRVLDIGTMLGGPVTATLLADFGAEVIKVEMPKVGDTLRWIGPFVKDESLYWAVEGRNKKSITIDFHKKKGQELFKKLVEKSDVVVENFRPGTLKKWGLDYDSLKKVNERIIISSVSGFGQTGPYNTKAAYDRIALAFSGFLDITGFSDRAPVRPGIAIADYMGALFSAFSVVLALYHRDINNGQQGQHIDVSLYETIFRFTDVLTVSYDKLGIIRERRGNRHFAAAPGDHFRTKDDKYVVITVSSDALFKRLCAAIGREELVEDQRFISHHKRFENIDEINQIVADWILPKTAVEVIELLEKHSVPCSQIYNIEDIVNDVHYQARESIIEVEHSRLGPLKMQGIVPKFSRTPGKINSLGPLLGEHNQEILQNILNLDDLEVENLKHEGVI